MRRPQLPPQKLTPSAAVIAGGMNLVEPPQFAEPGTAVVAYNYEYGVNGGVDRVKGIEPFDGRAAPSDATYVYFQATATIAGIAVGDAVTGATSGATARAIYVSGAYVAMTMVVGTFVVEGLQVGGITRATVSSLTAPVDGFLDNTLAKLAADEYQALIGKVPGAGRVRGLAILNDVVYAWRNNVGQTELKLYKSSNAGWVIVPMYHQVSFTAGSAEYAEGASITQGGNTATVKRVVLESGSWGAGSAAGRLIITAPTPGSFGAGAAAGGGAVTLSGANALIVLAPGGVVSADVYNFTASLSTKRLYGCDGINPEFEFDGDILVPLNTGMGSVRATVARCHKNHLFFGYRGSLQHSSIAFPYQFSAVTGAGELGTGDVITNLISVGGATDAASLMVTCENALYVLYGTSSGDWNLVPLSRVQGAQARTAQDIGGVVALDTPGVVRYPATQSFGNFAWDTVSMPIQPAAAKTRANCSVFSPGEFKYRIFLTDGTVLSGLPVAKQKFHWSIVNYGVTMVLAENAEIAGDARTFYADEDGWVYEADKGRSFAGASIQYALKLHPMNQGSQVVEKAYRGGLLEVRATSACTISTAFEFYDDEGPSASQPNTLSQYGVGLIYDLGNYDASYWDSGGTTSKAVPIDGRGTAFSLMVAGDSDSELSHTLFSFTALYTPQRIVQ